MGYAIKLAGGEYTVINHGRKLEFLRDGQSYLANIPVNSSEILAMAERIVELETTIRAVVDGTLQPTTGARNEDGLRQNKLMPSINQLTVWETALRNVLEQK